LLPIIEIEEKIRVIAQKVITRIKAGWIDRTEAQKKQASRLLQFFSCLLESNLSKT